MSSALGHEVRIRVVATTLLRYFRQRFLSRPGAQCHTTELVFGHGFCATPDGSVPELHALATSTALRAKGLRFVLINELMAYPTRTIAQLVANLEGYGYTLPGRPSKVISDALRWEVRRGRVRRVARGLYRYQSAPKSTARRIRLFAAVCHRWIVATTRNEPPPAKPLPCPKRYNTTNEASPWPPWTDLRWLWTR